MSLLRCPECEAENQIGSIFCRSCGARLELDTIRPMTDNQAREAGVHKMGKGSQAASAVVAIILILFLIGFFFPASSPVKGELGSAQSNELAAKVNLMTNSVGRNARFTFTEDQVTAFVNAQLGLSGRGSDGLSMAPEHLAVELLPSSYVRLTLKSRLLGKVPVYSTLVGRFDVGSGVVDFVPFKAKTGKLPMPGPLKGMVVKRFSSLLPAATLLKQIGSVTQELDVAGGEVTITL